MKRLNIFILIFSILLCHLSVGIAEVNSINAFSHANRLTQDFLCCMDKTNSALYYCVDKKAFIWNYSVIYEVKDGKNVPLLWSRDTISGFLVQDNVIYYVSHDDFSGRGKLIRFDPASMTKNTLLDVGYGVGALFSIIDNDLYLETDIHIAKLNLDTLEISKLADKAYYVSSASAQGITAYSGSDWYFYAWDSTEPVYFKNYQNPLTDRIFIMALNDNQYIVLNGKDFSCSIYCHDEVKREEHVISACLADDTAALFIQGDRSIVRIYKLGDMIEWINDAQTDCDSLVYQFEGKNIMMNDKQELFIIP